jgi:hypothetical protein
MSFAGRIDTYFFDQLATHRRKEQDRCWQEIARHQEAYLEAVIGLLELAGNAHAIFEKEDPLEKGRLLVRTARGATESFAPPSANRLIYLQKRPPLRRSPIQFTDKIRRASGLAALPGRVSNSSTICNCRSIASCGCWITLRDGRCRGSGRSRTPPVSASLQPGCPNSCALTAANNLTATSTLLLQIANDIAAEAERMAAAERRFSERRGQKTERRAR